MIHSLKQLNCLFIQLQTGLAIKLYKTNSAFDHSIS